MIKFIDSLLLGMRRRSRRSELEALDDRLLADMGLTRSDLRAKPRRDGKSF